MAEPTDPATDDVVTTREPGDDDHSLLKAVLGMTVREPPLVLAAGEVIAETYRIERSLGAGGMGEVYLARDLRLRREVAIKLHLPRASAARLEQEAAAIARLSHPNVVTVYQIDTYRGRPFVAMEYVPGGTARGWLAAAPRSRRAIVELYLAAARGLAAAHAAGLVHRDFKPDNVLVGDDGRARVADFGLAREVERGAPDPDPTVDVERTGTGATLGTPAYMAPEQHDGAEVGAAADQFGFAVSLWEALAGERPFSGASTVALRAAIARAERRGRGRIPRGLERTLSRALAEDAAARYPSMDALIAALERAAAAPGRRRRIAAVVIAAGALAAGAGGLAMRGGVAAAADPCGDGEAQVAAIWNPERREAIERAFEATGSPRAADTARRLAAALDRHAASWMAERRAVCAGAPAPALGLACFEERLAETAAIVDVLVDADAGTVDTALDVLLLRAPLAECGDAERLAGLPAPPAGAAEAVRATRRLLGEGHALLRARRAPEARDLAVAATAAADEIAWAPLGAEVLLLRGMAPGDDPAAARRDLEEAYRTAIAAGHPTIAVRAAAQLADPQASDPERLADARAWSDRALAQLEHGRAGSHDEVVVRLRRAHLEYGAGRYADALAHAERGLAVAEALPGDHGVFVLRAESAVGIELDLLGRYEEARHHLERGLRIAEEIYGADSPALRPHLINLGALLRGLGRHTDALLMGERNLALTRATLGDDDPEVARIRINLGIIRQARREPEQAISQYQEARRIFEAAYGADHPHVAMVVGNLASAHVDRGENDLGLTLARQALATFEQAYGPRHPSTARARVGVAVALRSLRRPAEALPLLRDAIAVFEEVLPDSVEVASAYSAIGAVHAMAGQRDQAVAAYERAVALRRRHSESGMDLADTLVHMAQVLWDRGDRARAREVATEGRDLYRHAGPAAEVFLLQAEQWLTTRDDPRRAAKVSYFD